ncbi:glycosyltransferase family 4 protein [Spirosoma sp.]|uniref:glycosyltransferase family 4 protein n=1 Tax=Spirosoma sp. TaxID=1899569 RepID=UPI00262CDF96|nr:glycosyltransferase family 4 protein [Spirosoma sp.]MCX6218958.1 glycosyltransferase family 4 protein [Spirosoma sp.]
MKDLGNVLQFMNYNAPYAGNFIRSLTNLEETLSVEGLKMVYLFPKKVANRSWAQELIDSNKDVFFLSDNFFRDIVTIMSLLKKFNIKIIHTHFTDSKIHMYFNLVRYLFNRKIFIVRHLHNHYKPSNYVVEFLKRASSRIDFYIGCGQSVADHYSQEFRISKAQVSSVPNAIDFQRLESYTILTNASLPEGTKRFLLFGFDYYRKGVDIAIEAIDELRKENYEVCLLISLSKNKEFISSKIIEKFGEIPDWLFLVEARDDIATYYRSSDIFISSSRAEGLCYSLIEAAYCQVPIIASDIPGHTSLNIPYITHFLPQDASSLKRALIEVLSMNEDMKQRQAIARKEFVSKEFDLAEWSDRILATYMSL